MNREKRTSVREFVFHGTLVVPRWGEFWSRYLLLLIMGVATVGLTSFHSPWLRWDKQAGTVRSFGITIHPKAATVDFQGAVNDVYRATIVFIYGAYILLAVGVYGPRRFWQAATRASMKRVTGYVIGIGAILILGGYMFEWFVVYSGDPESTQCKSVSTILLVGVIGPIMEEVFARFTLYQTIRAKFPFWIAAILSSLAFGLLHFAYPEPVKMLMGGIAGIFLCWTYEKTDSILTPIGIHVLNNLWMQLG